jgi:rhodanese-related sulfurtransferase
MNDQTFYIIFGLLILWISYQRGWIFANFKSITAKQALDLLEEKDIAILDVRTQEEYKSTHIENSFCIPVSELKDNIKRLDKYKTILVYCLSGSRSVSACRFLNKHHINAINIKGGIFSLQNSGAKSI